MVYVFLFLEFIYIKSEKNNLKYLDILLDYILLNVN